MYCVKCGVRLQDGVESCPLCRTPVWNPDAETEEKGYPDHYPHSHRESSLPIAAALTVIFAAAALVLLIVCLRLYGELSWGGYALCSLGLAYIIGILPAWFEDPLPEVFVPVDHAAALLAVLYVCLKTGGNWFLSFAFPVGIISGLLSTALICLLKYVKGGRLFILGGFLMVLGGASMLIELFEHITFGTPMFLWSLYSLVGFGLAGLFLLLARLIPPLRHGIEKRFFF